MTGNRTTKLRKLLTERGIEYETNDYMGVCETSWNGFTVMQLTPSAKLIMTVTPEQAIAVTLGSEREKAIEKMARSLYANYHDEWPDRAEEAYTERMKELGIEVIDDER